MDQDGRSAPLIDAVNIHDQTDPGATLNELDFRLWWPTWVAGTADDRCGGDVVPQLLYYQPVVERGGSFTREALTRN